MPQKSIFIVEDEGLVAKDVQNRLTSQGYGIAGWAISGEEAISEVEKTSPDLVLMAALISLGLVGILTPRETFSGFANPAPLTVAALYVLARAVEKTGALQPVVSAMLGGRGAIRSALLRLALPTAAASAFLTGEIPLVLTIHGGPMAASTMPSV